MAFRVEIQPQAFDDLDGLASAIRCGSSFEMAQRWFNGMMTAIASLSEVPERCALAPEAEEVGDAIRLLLYGRRNRSYKIYFKVQPESQTTGKVWVLHVRHWARRPLTEDELDELMDDQDE